MRQLALFVMLATALAGAPAQISCQTYLEERIAAAGLPGASLAVVQDGEPVCTAVTGVADLSERRPVTPDTVYAIGSVTKSFTATAVLQLRERGLIELDAPVQQYLPWFRLAGPQGDRPITLRQLLTHTSGIPVTAHSVVWRDPDRIRPSLTEGVRALAGVRPVTSPGERFEYSNMNYAVLGLVVEQVSGLPYPDYIRQAILEPLGMERSATAVAELAGLDAATPYAPSFGRLAEAPRESGAFHGPAYLLFASAPDLARYAAAHLEPGRILPAPSLDEAHTGAVAMGSGMRYGLGWIEEQIGGEQVIWHQGGSGHSAFVALIPSQKQAVVLLTGAYSTEVTTETGKGLVHLLLGQEPPAPRYRRNPALSMDRIALALLAAGLVALAAGGWMLATYRHRTRLALSGLALRAFSLSLLAATLWTLALWLPPRFGLPAPFGWFGYPPDLLITMGVWLLAGTLWAIWGLESFLYHRRVWLLQHRA